MEESKIEATQADLPPIKNYPLFFLRVVRKLFVVAFFGISTLILVAFILPVMGFAIRDKAKFKKRAHRFISYSLQFYINFLSFLKVSDYKISAEDLQVLRNAKGCVVTANHPSLLDTIYMLAFVRDAYCIGRANLEKNFVLSGVVKRLYILNSVDFEIMKTECIQALRNEGTIIIFPEGTRSPADGIGKFKKGAARIALAAGVNIQPLHIGGNRKYGLGKGEAMWKVPPTEHYKYEFKLLPQIDISKYAGLTDTIAAKHLTEDMRAAIESAN